jgi:hypothetical protein
MNLNTIIKNPQTFTDRILSEIQNKPFGSLPKVELELVILDALIKSLEPTDSYSNLESHINFLQRELRLTQTQLKNKILAAQLRFDSINEKDVENYILKSILSGKYNIDGGYIVILIFNPLLNDLAKSYFETIQIITDTSFNKSILKINLNGFLKFLFKADGINEKQKQKINELLLEAKDEGLISISTENSFDTKIDHIDKVVSIGTSLITFIEKLTPIITNIVS